MRRFLVLAGPLAACLAVAGCNPPIKQVMVPCNCQGNVTTANPGAESQRFVPPGDKDPAYAALAHHHYRRARHTYGEYDRYTYRRSQQHGYQGSDEAYARYWSSTRVAMNSYDYRSASRVYHTAGYESGPSSGTYGSGGDFAGEPEHTESGWQDGYGRIHRGMQLSRGEFHARMDPWRGYDVDCPDGDHRRYHHHHH